MTPRKPSAASASAPDSDPIFALIAEHKALMKEYNRHHANFLAAKSQAGKKHGKSLEGIARSTTLPYGRWCRADTAAREGGMRMARTKPETPAGVAALAEYTRRNYTDEINEDWAAIALKTVCVALSRMNTVAA